MGGSADAPRWSLSSSARRQWRGRRRRRVQRTDGRFAASGVQLQPAGVQLQPAGVQLQHASVQLQGVAISAPNLGVMSHPHAADSAAAVAPSATGGAATGGDGSLMTRREATGDSEHLPASVVAPVASLPVEVFSVGGVTGAAGKFKRPLDMTEADDPSPPSDGQSEGGAESSHAAAADVKRRRGGGAAALPELVVLEDGSGGGGAGGSLPPSTLKV